LEFGINNDTLRTLALPIKSKYAQIQKLGAKMAVANNKAVFLDRDGVLIVEKNFQVDFSKAEYIPRSVDALKALPNDYLKIIISNQSGIARGYFSIEQVESFNKALVADLKIHNVTIDAFYFCPHGPDDNCDCRKPQIGLFERANEQFSIDYKKSWMIGDKSSDIQAGKNIGAKTILVLTGFAGKEPGANDVKPNFITKDLFEAMEIITK
jgi:D-glycero-D-manno-heptose 1,7-bisphosphate phosphatase